jgi:threonine aldolase
VLSGAVLTVLDGDRGTFTGETLDAAVRIVIFEVVDASDFCRRLEADGVRMGALDDRTVRAVTHLDVDDAGIERAFEAARSAVSAGVG